VDPSFHYLFGRSFGSACQVAPESEARVSDFLFLSCSLVAVWPTLIWFFERYTDRSDDPLGIVALITLVVIVWLRSRSDGARKLTESGSKRGNKTGEAIVCLVLVTYSLAAIWASKSIQAFLALTILGLAISRFNGLRRTILGDWMLLYLTLPVVASLNFYAGYPLRLLLTRLAGAILRGEGFHVSTEGTMLLWNSQFTEVDAPCSGLKMLWFAVFLTATLSSLYRFRFTKILVLLAISVIGALLANLLRVTSLFFIENHVFNLTLSQEWHSILHQGVGASVFVLLSGIIVFSALKLSSNPQVVVSAGSSVDGTGVGAKLPTFPGTNFLNNSYTFVCLCLIAAVAPLVALPSSRTLQAHGFSGWPTRFEGKEISQLPEDDTLREFGKDFPGKIGLFTDGQETMCLRWITHETRQLHPASDCYKGLGYRTEFQPSTTDEAGNRWHQFSAARGEKHLHIRERIFDLQNNSWSDVSAWYWDAVWQKTRPPWWSVTVISR
jgi:exosortase